MALSLPKAKSLAITASSDEGKTSETIELTTKVGQLNPLLTIPSLLDLLRNTSVTPSSNMAENTRIYGMDKNAYSDIVDASGKFTDPRGFTADSRELLVKQLSPVMSGAKYHNLAWDSDMEGLQDVLGRALGNHIMERRTIKEQGLLKEAADAAVAQQALVVADDATALDFKTGAHVQVKAITSSDEAYQAFVDATANYQKIGLDSAKAGLNKSYKHARGINKADIIVLGTPEFEAQLLGKQGVFASESGNALFKAAGIKKVLGVDFTSAVTLPEDVDFLVLTTGINGALSHEMISVGTAGKILVDPEWSFGKRLDLVDAYTMGIVYPFQIFASKAK